MVSKINLFLIKTLLVIVVLVTMYASIIVLNDDIINNNNVNLLKRSLDHIVVTSCSASRD